MTGVGAVRDAGLRDRFLAGMSYDGHSLVTRPLASAAAPSRLVLTTRARGTLPKAAEAFRAVCLDLFAGRMDNPDANAFAGLE